MKYRNIILFFGLLLLTNLAFSMEGPEEQTSAQAIKSFQLIGLDPNKKIEIAASGNNIYIIAFVNQSDQQRLMHYKLTQTGIVLFQHRNLNDTKNPRINKSFSHLTSNQKGDIAFTNGDTTFYYA